MESQLTIIDLDGCKKGSMNKMNIERFLINLSKIIGTKSFGKLFFRQDSAIQIVEDKNISIYMDENANKAFVNLFSCGKFDHLKVKEFTRQFFEAKRVFCKTIIRK